MFTETSHFDWFVIFSGLTRSLQNETRFWYLDKTQREAANLRLIRAFKDV